MTDQVPAEITDEQWRKVMATDADAVFFGCRASSISRNQRGAIVNAALVSGTSGDCSPNNPVKDAVVNVTHALAMELGAKVVRVIPSAQSDAHTGNPNAALDGGVSDSRRRNSRRRRSAPTWFVSILGWARLFREQGFGKAGK